MRNQRAAQRRPAGPMEARRASEWRPAPNLHPAPASPMLTLQALAAPDFRVAPSGHSFGQLALFPTAPVTDGPVVGTARPEPVAVQRLIYKDDKAREEKAPYADITKVPWYEGKKSREEKDLILRAAKVGGIHFTTAEVDAMLKKRGALADLIAVKERMSGHEDMAVHEKVAPTDRLLTPTEFALLPDRGSINPYRLRTAQGGIELRFRDPSKGKVSDLAENLVKDPGYSRKQKIDPVEIGIFNDRVWSFDTRRVVAHQMARKDNPLVEIEYVKISPQSLEKRVGSIYTPRQGMGIVTAVRYEGRNSGSNPWVNPAYAEQMGSVETQWDYSSYDFPEELREDSGERFGLANRQHGALARLRLRLVRVVGDNDCLFHAVLVGTGWRKSIETFRGQVADWVEVHRDQLVQNGHLDANRQAEVLADIRRVGSYFNEGGYVAYEAMGAYLEERGFALWVIQQSGHVQQVANNAALPPVYLVATANPPHSHFHAAAPKR